VKDAIRVWRHATWGFYQPHAARGGGLEALAAMEGNAARAIEELASVPVDAIAYCCTVSGALRA
jgi:hypothetical protein